MDFSGEFDTVSHSLLVHNIHNYRIEGNVNSMTQAVIFEGKKKTYVSMESGVPQESVLDLSLFLYYTWYTRYSSRSNIHHATTYRQLHCNI